MLKATEAQKGSEETALEEPLEELEELENLCLTRSFVFGDERAGDESAASQSIFRSALLPAEEETPVSPASDALADDALADGAPAPAENIIDALLPLMGVDETTPPAQINEIQTHPSPPPVADTIPPETVAETHSPDPTPVDEAPAPAPPACDDLGDVEMESAEAQPADAVENSIQSDSFLADLDAIAGIMVSARSETSAVERNVPTFQRPSGPPSCSYSLTQTSQKSKYAHVTSRIFESRAKNTAARNPTGKQGNQGKGKAAMGRPGKDLPGKDRPGKDAMRNRDPESSPPLNRDLEMHLEQYFESMDRNIDDLLLC